MDDLISRQALCEYALNQKDKSITPNDIMRFPSAQPEKRTHERTETHSCDCISRQAAVSAFWELNIELRPSCIDAIIDMLKGLPSLPSDMSGYSDKLWKAAYERGKAEAQQRWIPCSERLPEQPNPNPELEGKPLDIYLVCKQGNIPFRAFWNGRNFADGWTSLDVDAWMPLPEAYREGES